MSLLPQIEQSLQALDVHFDVATGQLAQRIEQYLLLIEKWNKIHNLTAIRDPRAMLTQHVLDSLAVLPHIHGPRIVDVGTGAGLPGIPIALARPDSQIILVESNQKKAVFLQQVKIELALHNVEIRMQRIEDVRLTGTVDTIITRAFSELGKFVALTRNLTVENDEDRRWVAMKANCADNELRQIVDPFYLETIIPLAVPGLDAARQLVIIKQRI
ncbi:MAG: 16S rRNA (guanine(527)-N(7))-methyltransferase RsmG [Gammaproteobacteria bacterium]|uniref:Ribosomal RNA small subunit methyltransferase G n=1 Tax=candidate division WWE3 bacterium TaxID=2053526 RepID=A0A928TXW4_UNCKA|nr:16S rRNA (guanine(527)-N(7))-methyltransferase RsmG [candidate division WWE3 bacterium]QOJ20822.1 MAG: 16S rRNA (guanine(527)-N(7))-methyltransferase RsmG [Gammaproteobacteria bacterium]